MLMKYYSIITTQKNNNINFSDGSKLIYGVNKQNVKYKLFSMNWYPKLCVQNIQIDTINKLIKNDSISTDIDLNQQPKN